MNGGQQSGLGELHRLLLGQEPPTYFIELLLRSVVLYAVLMMAMRLLGKRMSSQLSRTEMVAMVSLAAAIGVPLLSSDRGLLPAVVVAAVVVVIGRLIATGARKYGAFETAVQGTLSVLVQDGTLCVDAMAKTRLTRERVLAQLRNRSLHQLGLVQRLYLEASGTFTLIKATQPRPGLSLIPDWDADFARDLKSRPDQPVCANCGDTATAGAGGHQRCRNCGFTTWIPGVE